MYAVTWPDEPEVVYASRDALDSAVRQRASAFVSELKSRLDTGWQMIQKDPSNSKLQDFWVGLYQQYNLLVRWTQ